MSSKNTDGALPKSPDLNSAATRHAHPRVVDAAGAIVDAFRPSRLAPSGHPALDSGNAGGAVTALEALIAASRQ
jgi:hypothetical protein